MLVSAEPDSISVVPLMSCTSRPSRVAPTVRPAGTLVTSTTEVVVALFVTVTLPAGSSGWVSPCTVLVRREEANTSPGCTGSARQ